ncbi:MAG TPA: hypothetical protein VJ346_09405 [Bacteroidales bacterium]|nr:hypothetical protein [Bacteroidales bacterium]
METKTPLTNKSYIDNEPRKRSTAILMVIIGLLTVAITVLGIMLYQNSQKYNEEKQLIVEEKMDLERQLNEMIIEYDDLKTENDSVNSLLSTEQEKIIRLLKIDASNAQKIKMYKQELETLRSVMRSYIVQIDSLNTRNRELTEENIQVRTQLTRVEQDREMLTKEKEDLTSQVAIASVLSAKNITAEGLNKKSKPNEKAAKIEKIKVCLTIRENPIVKAGKKMIYLRIIRPDEVVLTAGGNTMIEINGEQHVYTTYRELEYENQDIDMCIFWDRTEELIAGTYTATLFAEGAEIGSTTFDLK